MKEKLKAFYKTLIIFKKPEFENDSFLVKLCNFQIAQEDIESLSTKNPYLNLKIEKFQNKDISIDGFEKFSTRLSLRELNPQKKLTGTIYTKAVEIQNKDISYELIIGLIKKMLLLNPRRTALRLINPISDYYNSIYSHVDVTCLNVIYYGENCVKLVFRASDVRDELYTDIITVYKFFILPIYSKPVDLEIFASTAQNTKSFFNIF